LRRGPRTRRLALESLYLGYQVKALEPGEFIAAVRVPRTTGAWVASYKVSKRFDQDISAVCAAFCIEVTDGQVVRARAAFGGMAAIPARSPAVEKALIGAAWNSSTIESAAAALAVDFTPLSDMRASDAYRLQCARNLLRRFHLEHSHAQPPLRVADVPVEAPEEPV
jgi:xanthine dehydrogenase small subunit